MPPASHLMPRTQGAVSGSLFAGCATGLMVESDVLTVSGVFLCRQT